ncbi:MAG: class I SAM-dependent methyltransferase [Xenococcaceae cyanobacterium]
MTYQLMINHHIEQLPPCPACNNQKFKWLFVKDGRHFWRCTNCHLEKQYPLPSLEELEQYYQQSYISGMYKLFADKVDLNVHIAKRRFKAVRSYCQPGRWLDVGASVGTFINLARSEGIEAEGIELARAAVDRAKAQGIPVSCSTLKEFTPSYCYDTITAFDVLEHVVNPLEFLHSLHGLLKPGGKFVLAVPNQGSLQRWLMGHHWFYYIPEHLFYYNTRCMHQLLARASLEMLKVSMELKPISFNYMLIWVEERYPLFYKLIWPLSKPISYHFGDSSIPLPLADMLVFGQRPF